MGVVIRLNLLGLGGMDLMNVKRFVWLIRHWVCVITLGILCFYGGFLMAGNRLRGIICGITDILWIFTY